MDFVINSIPPKYLEYGARACAVVGLYFIGSKFLSFLRLLLSLFVLPGMPLSTFGPTGSWAVVTGASDGIGKEFALQLARKGFNILLVSRTASKLSALASEIESASHVQTKTLAMDFAENSDADYARLDALTKDLDIAILANNVGKSHDIPVLFAMTSAAEMHDIITINCTGTLRVTAVILPGMLARKRGLILTMGSFGGLLPTPLLATYSGSKAFLQQWSSALGEEVAAQGVTVELVQSYLVTSAMSKVRKASTFVPTPRAFVRSVLGKIGERGGAQGMAYSSTPYWSHGFMQWGLGISAGTTGEFIVGQMRVMHEGIRKRALRKRERDAGKKGE